MNSYSISLGKFGMLSYKTDCYVMGNMRYERALQLAKDWVDDYINTTVTINNLKVTITGIQIVHDGDHVNFMLLYHSTQPIKGHCKMGITHLNTGISELKRGVLGLIFMVVSDYSFRFNGLYASNTDNKFWTKVC